jgi:hypothetical protein
MNILLGIVLIGAGAWLTIVQTKYLWNGKSDYSGGHIKMLIGGVGLVAGGIIIITQSI